MKLIKLISLHLHTLKWHLYFWVPFIAYEVFAAYFANGGFSRPIDYVTFYIINIGLFYLTAAIIVKNSANGKLGYVKIAGYILFEIVIYLAVKYYITPLYIALGFYKTSVKTPAFFVFLGLNLIRAVYFIGFATAYALSQLTVTSLKRIAELDKQSLQNRLEQETLQKDLLASQYAFLKAQVNPHFLFNMLSFLHSNVYKYSEQLGDQIIHLADLMRYAFTEPEADGKVELAAEIAHIENYLSLNKIRFNDQLYLNFNSTGNIDDIRIIPLVLITIIENIFKYGDLSDPKHPATINIDVDDHRLHLQINNRKIKRNHALSSGIGMVNVQKRLDLAYPEQYDLNIIQDDIDYQLDLLINFPQNEVLHN